ncbi:MAG: cupin domain-containing protein [Candidatus Latescibacteria bacterium]|nr:cupin domain-containing protein [Candidatus Latescibacterota bacterium]
MKKKIKPKVINLNKTKGKHFSILAGSPQSVTMCSGLVSLKPGDSVGEHSTKDYEELIIILEGNGIVKVKGQKLIKAKPGIAVYNPPQTEHNVINTSKKPLRYIYVVAKTKI